MKKKKKKERKKKEKEEKNDQNSEMFYCNSNIIIYILHFSQIKVILCVLRFRNDVQYK